MSDKANLMKAEGLLDDVLSGEYEGDKWVAIGEAHRLIEEVVDE